MASVEIMLRVDGFSDDVSVPDGFSDEVSVPDGFC